MLRISSSLTPVRSTFVSVGSYQQFIRQKANNVDFRSTSICFGKRRPMGCLTLSRVQQQYHPPSHFKFYSSCSSNRNSRYAFECRRVSSCIYISCSKSCSGSRTSSCSIRSTLGNRRAQQQPKQGLAQHNLSIWRFTSTEAGVERQATDISNGNGSGGKHRWSSLGTAGVAVASLAFGFSLGRLYKKNDHDQHHHTAVLPNGLPRTCCDDEPIKEELEQKQQGRNILTESQQQLPWILRSIVGKENIIMDGTVYNTTTLPFLKGSRLGMGKALCIVTPTKLSQVISIVKATVDANCVILPQGQNTGLTGGSVPRGGHCDGTKSDPPSDDDRPVVILSMKKLDRMFPIDDGKRIVCLAGVGLASLQQFIQQYFPNREPHSVLGSTFLNPTVAAGLAFGSGGTQCRKGPAYTERAMYLKVTTNKWNEKNVTIVNSLGIRDLDDVMGIDYIYDDVHDDDEDQDNSYDLSDDNMESTSKTRVGDADPYNEEKQHNLRVTANRLDIWSRYIAGGYTNEMRYSSKASVHGSKRASDHGYADRLCNLPIQDTTTVSRYNADIRGPEYCRSEGKVVILASIHDTFLKPKKTKTYWIGFDSLETALAFRSDVCLSSKQDMPISMEYMDRDAFDVINRSGRVLGTVIKYTGTSSPLVRQLWNLKLYIEALPFDGADTIIDKVLHHVNNFFPSILPKAIMNIGTSMNHNVAITVGDFDENDEDDFNKENTDETASSTTLERFERRLELFRNQHGGNNNDKVKVYECHSNNSDIASITAFRFVAAPAFRTWCVGEGNVHGLSIDYALPIHAGTAPPLDGSEELPLHSIQPDNTSSLTTETTSPNHILPKPVKRMRYSHFACNVVHEDIAYSTNSNGSSDVAKDVVSAEDLHNIKHTLKHIIEHNCHGKLPAEHGHGTEYIAPTETKQRWMQIDPLNVLNPGVGGLSTAYKYITRK